MHVAKHRKPGPMPEEKTLTGRNLHMPNQRKKTPPPRQALAVSVSVVGDRDATTAWASLVGGPYTQDIAQAAGSSRRNVGDPYDPRIASDLAVGRALIKLGLELLTSGAQRVQLEADARYAGQLLAAINKTERRLRATGPHPGLLSLTEVLSEYGLEAAETAAKRRGLEMELAELVGPPQVSEVLEHQDPGGYRDNGLPTITSDTTMETS